MGYFFIDDMESRLCDITSGVLKVPVVLVTDYSGYVYKFKVKFRCLGAPLALVGIVSETLKWLKIQYYMYMGDWQTFILLSNVKT